MSSRLIKFISAVESEVFYQCYLYSKNYSFNFLFKHIIGKALGQGIQSKFLADIEWVGWSTAVSRVVDTSR